MPGLLELFERSCFLVQPASHPPAPARWRYLRDRALTRWFEDFDTAHGQVAESLLAGLEAIAELPRAADVDTAEGLGDRLDRRLWRHGEWAKAAELSYLLAAIDRQALLVLKTWRGWRPGTDVGGAIQQQVQLLIDDPAAQAILRAAATGSRSVTRLEAVQELTAVAKAKAHASIGEAEPRAHGQPFPAWAVAILAMNALSHSADTEHGAPTRDTSGQEEGV